MAITTVEIASLAGAGALAWFVLAPAAVPTESPATRAAVSALAAKDKAAQVAQVAALYAQGMAAVVAEGKAASDIQQWTTNSPTWAILNKDSALASAAPICVGKGPCPLSYTVSLTKRMADSKKYDFKDYLAILKDFGLSRGDNMHSYSWI
jgi:hypothetical protein